MNRNLIGCALAGVVALAVGVNAQNPTPQSQPQTRVDSESARMATVEGCLRMEKDVAGREPNVAERAGIMEDYILTDAKVVKGTSPVASAARSGDRPTGTAGSRDTTAGSRGTPAEPRDTTAGARDNMAASRNTMFEVTGIDDEELKKHVGHRVQIDGTFENVDQARDPAERGTPNDDLVEIHGKAIRQLSGSCAAANQQK